MGGRKVCFTDEHGQIGTCIRDDENCVHCSAYTTHYKWIKREKVISGTDRKCEDYYTKLCKEMHVLEQTVFGLRDCASALRRIGFEKISDELDWRAGNIEETIEKVDQLILASMKQEHANLDMENAHLKQILKNMNSG